MRRTGHPHESSRPENVRAVASFSVLKRSGWLARAQGAVAGVLTVDNSLPLFAVFVIGGSNLFFFTDTVKYGMALR
jgi:hypothetical protein